MTQRRSGEWIDVALYFLGWIVLIPALAPYLDHNTIEAGVYRAMRDDEPWAARWVGWWPVPNLSAIWWDVFPVVILAYIAALTWVAVLRPAQQRR